MRCPKLHKFFTLSLSEMGALTAYTFLLIYYKILVLFLPYRFYKSYFRLGKPESVSTHNLGLTVSQKQKLDLLKTTHNRVRSWIPWKHSFCLVNALAMSHRCSAKGIPHRLILGVKGESTDLHAHAWITAGEHPLVGVKESTGYTVVGVFEKKMLKKSYTPFILKTSLGKWFIKTLLKKDYPTRCLPTYFQRKAVRLSLGFPRNASEDNLILDRLSAETQSRWKASLLPHLNTQHAIKKQADETKKHLVIQTFLLLGSMKQIITLFSKNQIPVILLKGMAMTVRFYKEIGIRQMGDWDAIIPAPHLDKTIACLAEKNLIYDPKEPPPALYFKNRHALAFRRDKKTEIDLHLYLFRDFVGRHTFEEIETQQVEWNGMAIQIPVNELLFLMCIAHGFEYKIVRDFRWLIDAATILRSTENTFDWEKLIRLAYRFEKTLVLKHGLKTLALTTKQKAPQWVSQKLIQDDEGILKKEHRALWFRLLPSTKIRNALRKIVDAC